MVEFRKKNVGQKIYYYFSPDIYSVLGKFYWLESFLNIFAYMYPSTFI